MRKDLVLNAIGIGGGQAVVLLVTPFLARIYSPTEFGQYAAVVASAGIIATIASLRFDVALPAVPDDDVNPLFQIALVLPLFVSLAAVAAAAILSINGMGAMTTMVAASPPWVASVGAMQGIANLCQAWFTRAGEFKWFAALKILQPVVFAAIAAAAVVGLNGALAASWLFVVLFAFWGRRRAFSSFHLCRSWAAAKRARKYPLLSAPMALLDTASLALPLFFIVAAFGDEAAGNYSQVQRLLAAPLILLGIAVTQVFYKHAGDRHRSGRAVEPLMWRVVLSLLGLAVLLGIATWLVGERMMAMLLGGGWRTDFHFLLLAIAPVMFRMVVSPVSSVLLFTGRLGLISAFQASHFVVTVGVILLAQQRFALEGYLMALAFAELAMYLLYLILCVVAVRAGNSGRDKDSLGGEVSL